MWLRPYLLQHKAFHSWAARVFLHSRWLTGLKKLCGIKNKYSIMARIVTDYVKMISCIGHIHATPLLHMHMVRGAHWNRRFFALGGNSAWVMGWIMLAVNQYELVHVFGSALWLATSCFICFFVCVRKDTSFKKKEGGIHDC